MPLVRISVYDTMPTDKRGKLPGAVYDAMRESISIPENDLFVVLTAHLKGELVVDPQFMAMERSGDFTLVHITLRKGRTTEAKQALYRRIAHLVKERAGVEPDDVMIMLTENDLDDWSFGRGEAQYVLNAPAGKLTPARSSFVGESR
ncbi:phenylpyruvate tautomerase PptA (4-oxalocrotonate tautomerase family) [Silvibacterium bohemicum]|uniref:Phenylpyruvate tautomerase PptA (4-oxalocrotonate tautomerase family) n=1 Tax=Silvibacterium bohemicum TaxID=1577686 RepID=A0A841JN74_9BACT|nr:tautomerase family protein [Silvibacterium bohemicum]MBB6142703.1 phenylpyruvate tautomerase PptA (4-oxalocrotonate tautomerase family) [Silvibacterium bohemicum]